MPAPKSARALILELLETERAKKKDAWEGRDRALEKAIAACQEAFGPEEPTNPDFPYPNLRTRTYGIIHGILERQTPEGPVLDTWCSRMHLIKNFGWTTEPVTCLDCKARQEAAERRNKKE